MLIAEVEYTDPRTDERRRAILSEQEPEKRRKPRDKDFLRMRPWACAQLAKMRLSGAEWSILSYLLSKAVWANYVPFRSAELVQELGLSRKTVWAALDRLGELGITLYPSATIRDACWIRPIYCWKGHTDALYAEEEKFKKAWSEQRGRAIDAPPPSEVV